ncbi:MAG: helix-turn-helix domain-containing protein [Candidatus Aminicenantes bacterium]|nr:helix-turn-helix domain-containing protein [Candidatus Aminicenantes bacterium]
MENEIIAGNLLRLRKARKLSQQQVAAAAGISRVGYRKIENRESKPRVDTLKAIATALEVNIRELVTPVRQLSHVRFRSQKTFNTREQILAEIGEKLENYSELESLLNLQIDNRLAKIRLLPKRKKNPQEVADRARKQFKLTADEPIVNICGLLEANGVKVISMRRTSENFFGLSVSALDGGPAVIVNIWERIPVERWIFSAVHELGHLILHLPAFDVREIDENLEEEKEANLFASYFLMPQEAFVREWQNTYGLPLSGRVLKIKRIFKVSYKTVLYRLHENIPGMNVWKLFQNDYRQRYGKTLTSKEEPSALEASDYSGSVSEECKAHEPGNLSPLDFQCERLWYLVRKGIEAGKITLSKGAEVLGLSLEKMRELSRSWEAGI